MNRFFDSSKGPEPEEALPLILLAGPTASGKTSLSIELSRRLAERFSAEIVNADSMQVYRLMEIGTAKPSVEQRRIVPHHLIDVAEPDDPFDAARYLAHARPAIDRIRRRGGLPLVVGGTGLYMRVLTRGLCPAPPSSPEIKEKLTAEEKSRGLPGLYGDLLRVDPRSAAGIHPNDRQRIIRALEVFYLAGVPLSGLQQGHGFREILFPAVKVFINRERGALLERIERRVDFMVEAGLKDEVRGLLDMGFTADLKSMQSIGYRQMAAHLAGDLSMDEAVRRIKLETGRYAKRQVTWFRGECGFRFFDADDVQGIYSYIDRAIDQLGIKGRQAAKSGAGSRGQGR